MKYLTKPRHHRVDIELVELSQKNKLFVTG